MNKKSTSQFRVRRSVHFSGIPLRGIASVKSALTMFANGTRGSQETSIQMVRDSGEQGLMALGLMSLSETRNEAVFLQKLFTEMEESLENHGEFHRDYDYDGVGSFFKTDVRVTKLENDFYLLRLYAAYVGNKVERGLSKALKIKRALADASVEVEIPAIDNQFMIDFDAVLELVGKVLDLKGLTGEKAVSEIMSPPKYCRDLIKERVQVYETDKFVVVMTPRNVDGPIKYEGYAAKSILTWTAKGAVISGPVLPDCYDQTKFQTPIVSFHISSKEKDKYKASPQHVIEASEKKVLRDLATTIANSFT